MCKINPDDGWDCKSANYNTDMQERKFSFRQGHTECSLRIPCTHVSQQNPCTCGTDALWRPTKTSKLKHISMSCLRAAMSYRLCKPLQALKVNHSGRWFYEKQSVNYDINNMENQTSPLLTLSQDYLFTWNSRAHMVFHLNSNKPLLFIALL